MNTTIVEKIEKIRLIEKKYDDVLPSPMESTNKQEFIIEFKDMFNVEPDNEYLDFLNICDGIEFNGYKIYSSTNTTLNGVLHGVIELNNLFYEIDTNNRSYVFYGDSGSYLFVYNKKEKRYETIDRYSGSLIEFFESFNEILLYVLNLMLGEKT